MWEYEVVRYKVALDVIDCVNDDTVRVARLAGSANAAMCRAWRILRTNVLDCY